MRAEAPDGLPNATAIAAVLERLRALSEEEAQALGDAHSRWWHPTAEGTAFAAARRWHAKEAVCETLERRGVDVRRLESAARQAIAGPQWRAHPEMTGGEFADCAPRLRDPWAGSENAGVDAALAAAAADLLPDEAELIAHPWATAFGPAGRPEA